MKWEKVRIFFVLFLLILGLGRFFYRYPYSPDSYLHYTIGRTIIDTQKIPVHSDMSFKSVDSNLELVSHSWLADIILYIFYQVHPFAVLVGLLLPSAILTLYLLEKILKKLAVIRHVRMVAIGILAVFITVYWRPHPLIFAVPLSGLLIFFYLDNCFNRPKQWYKIFLITVLFANIAGGYIFMPVFFAAGLLVFSILTFILARFIKELKNYPDRVSLKNSLGVLAIILLASCINPQGFKLFNYGLVLYGLLARKWFATLPGILTATNSNVIRNTPSTIPYTGFLILSLFIFLGYCIYGLRKTKSFIQHVLPLTPLFSFIALGYFWVRFIPVSAFSAVIFLSVFINQALQGGATRTQSFMGKTALILLGLLALCYFIWPPKLLFIPYPDRLISYIKKHDMKLNFLSTYEYSGFTAYATYPAKANLDSQDDLFDENETISSYSEIDPVSKEFFDNIANTYSVNTVFTSKDADYLTATLSTHKDWGLYYLDSQGLVFGKKDSLSPEFINENALSRIDLSRNLGFDPQHTKEAIKQLENFTKKNPESALAKGQLASIYRFEKEFSKAEKVLNSIPTDQWTFVTFTEMGRLKAVQGLCKQSEEYLLQAVDQRDEKNLSRAVLDLAVLYAGCLNDKEKATHYFRRYNSFMIPQKERDFIKKLMYDFKITLEN